MNNQSISPQGLYELCSAGQTVDVIDVRTPAEFREVHVAAARNTPLDSLDVVSIMQSHAAGDGRPLYVICKSGSRSSKACQKLLAAGCVNLVVVEGGTDAWVDAGLPVVRGKKAVSLERQVRIAAGSLVLLGALLAWLVHPSFVALPAFVGAGLIFAGVTDTCGMGMLLTRMPWNRAAKDACPSPPTHLP